MRFEQPAQEATILDYKAEVDHAAARIVERDDCGVTIGLAEAAIRSRIAERGCDDAKGAKQAAA